MYVNEICYMEKYTMNWIEYTCQYSSSTAQTERFAHLSDLKIDNASAWEVSSHGRLRWKIENEGFNTQKRHGYGMEHKYSRKNLTAMRNYYELMQIAHLINQLTEKLQKVRDAIKSARTTIKAVVEEMISSMQKEQISIDDMKAAMQLTVQLRY